MPDRKKREIITLYHMVCIFCNHKHHGEITPCPDCADLIEYSKHKIINCPLGDSKSTCAKCTAHCYRSGYRDRIKVVMRYSGPRMIYKHPFLALEHFFSSFRRTNIGNKMFLK